MLSARLGENHLRPPLWENNKISTVQGLLPLDLPKHLVWFMIPVNVGGKTSGKNTLENQRDRAFPNRNDLEWYLVGLTEGPHSSRIGAFHSRHPMLGLKAWVLNPYRVDVISKAWRKPS